jgi:alkyldihydroxyacetonephosphate synthase
MAKRTAFRPPWSDEVPEADTWRAMFKYDRSAFKHPSGAWVRMFMEEFGMTEADFAERRATGEAPVSLDRAPRLDARRREALAAIVGAENVAVDDVSRIRYGHGKSLDEDLALREGRAPEVPDLVVHPRHKADVVEIVRWCAVHKIPLIPVGAGSGTVLGTRAEQGGVALVLKTHMNKVLAVNELNQTAVVQPGIVGPDYEAALNNAPELYGASRAFTCGHFPQSFELSSVGGWINALGSGQASTYYGDACDIVLSQEYVTPAGVVKTRDYPGTATGPKVNDVLKGSEGAYGVLVEATLRIFRRLPENRRRFAFLFPDWNAAVDAAREIVQGEFGMPAVLRISDSEETERGLKLKGMDGGPLNEFLRLRGFGPGKRCLCIGTAEGEKGYARHVARTAKRIARRYGAMSLTGYATKQWEHGRYSDVHIRDDLLDFGIVIDTIETGVTWETLHRVYEGVRAFAKSRPGMICMTHASHFYPQGTNLYFIFIMRPKDAEEYFRFRSEAVSRMVQLGGSVSHHHGVGRLFAPWLEPHLGPEQMAVLRALKAHFDPDNIMNPGRTLALDVPVPGGAAPPS